MPRNSSPCRASQAQPNAEKALAYSRQVASIAADTGAEFSRAAESQFAEVNRKVISLVDEVTKNAPAGSETYVSALKTAISNANAGYEQFSKTTKQAVEAIESNMNAAVSQFTPGHPQGRRRRQLGCRCLSASSALLPRLRKQNGPDRASGPGRLFLFAAAPQVAAAASTRPGTPPARADRPACRAHCRSW